MGIVTCIQTRGGVAYVVPAESVLGDMKEMLTQAGEEVNGIEIV